MNSRRFIMFIGVVAGSLHCSIGWSQIQAVQQPVVQQFRVGTSVSVPDQGQAYLGGVMRAADGRKIYGPLPSGSSLGRELSNSYQTVSVQILDFEEMDQAVLEIARRRSGDASLIAAPDRATTPPRAAFRSKMAEHAWKTLESRHSRR